MKETGAVIGHNGKIIFLHAPADRSMGALPDSRELWDFIWLHRDEVAGFAHTHPGSGVPGPSFEDVSSFSPIELALGRKLSWWISSADSTVVVRWSGPDKYSYQVELLPEEPDWVEEIRRLSLPEVEGHPV